MKSHDTSMFSGAFHHVTTFYLKLFVEITWKKRKKEKIKPYKKEIT